ncbi:hypothetical protein GTA51_00030 [Desulfovibrio aerotolerans]|uniref:Uncharacterized protein n=1 Tax=Solidesulfovibrio aerotolerans TaxID=295255 RepID=A0A7C9IJI4_9BACT|nr:hypothetical protein [Solidesulfovibrio aerotolerans]MYL81526.1 hypothetical protein [Solidesulfovibrio aerotolerans]
MTPVSSRTRLGLALALAWLLVAVAAAARDWPTPARLAEERYRTALLLANAVDKTFLPTVAVSDDDWQGPYHLLVNDFTARFGPRFDVAAIEARHDQALLSLTTERVRIVVFTLLATAAIWWLLATICTALGQTPHRT